MVAEAPAELRQRIENYPGAARRFDAVIRAWIDAAGEKDVKSRYSRSVGQRLEQCVKEIEQLAEMPNGLKLAFNLILYLGNKSCGPKYAPEYSRYRSWDEPADTLLLKLSKKILEIDSGFIPTEEVAQLRERIELLAAKDVNSYFPSSFDLMWSVVECPDTIQEFHDNLRAEILATYSKEDREAIRYERRYHNIGEKLEEYIPKIRRLRLMSLVGYKLAFDLVLYVGRYSYLDPPDHDRWMNQRRLDEEMDELLMGVANDIRNQEPDFKRQQAIDALRCELEYLAGHGVISYFPLSFKMLSKWMPETAKAYAVEIHDELKAKVSKAHKLLEKRLQIYVGDQKVPTTDWLGTKMLEFVEEIRALSSMLE